MDRYYKHSKLVPKEIRSLTIAVVGLGGLGSFVSYYLASLGVKKLILIDKDKVEISNLNRQILYNEDDIGEYKAIVAKERLRKFNRDITIESYAKDIKDIHKKIEEAYFIFDCLDNFEDKRYLDKLVHKNNQILIHGSVGNLKGQVYLHIPNRNPCLFDIFKGNFKEEDQILVTSVSIVASLMVNELIEFLKRRKDWEDRVVFYRYPNKLFTFKVK